MSSSHAERYATLDHWRGVAALAVLLFHTVSLWTAQSAPPGFGWFAALAAKGWLGVHLFFVISGYCVAQLALREVRGRKSPADFLRNRFLRIFPPYWAACLLAAGLALAALPFNHSVLFRNEAGLGALPRSFGEMIAHTFLTEPLFHRRPYLLVAWTLSWEVTYYLLMCALILIGIRFGLFLAATLGFLLAMAGVWPAVGAAWPALGGWAEFACGISVFAAHTAERENRAAWPWIGAIVALGIAGLIVRETAWLVVFAAGFALLLYILQRYDTRTSQARGGLWLGRCGIMSYSLYLIHAPVVSATRNLFSRFFPLSSAAFLLPIALAVLISIVAAWLFHHGIESPVERWRKSLERRPALGAT